MALSSSAEASTCSQPSQPNGNDGGNDSDIFLSIKNATEAINYIYEELFCKPRAEFMSLLNAKADVLELRYVRDMLFAITKRKKGLSTNIQIVEHKNSPADGLKDKLIKDVYDIYAFSEGSVKSLPKNLLKGHVSHAEKTTQTEDSIGNASLATISDVLLLKNTIMAEINDIKSKLEKVQVNKFNKPSSVDVGNVQCGNVDDTTVKTRPTHCMNEASVNVSIEEHEEDPAFTHISSYQYWSLTSDYPDLVKHFHLQMRIMGNFGLNGGVPWLEGTNGCVCYICQEGVEDNLHFLLDCSFLREHFSFLWSKLQQKILKLDLVDGPGIVSFLNNLDRASKALFLLGGLLLPFQKQMCIMIRKFVSIAVYKIYQLRLAKLREMEAPWLTS